MATNWSLHNIGNAVVTGQLTPAPLGPRIGGQVDLANNTESSDITVTGEGGVLIIVCDAKSRFDIRAEEDAADLNPATSPEVAPADIPVFRTLKPGVWNLEVTAY